MAFQSDANTAHIRPMLGENDDPSTTFPSIQELHFASPSQRPSAALDDASETSSIHSHDFVGGTEWTLETPKEQAHRAASYLLGEHEDLSDFQFQEEEGAIPIDKDIAVIDRYMEINREQKEKAKYLFQGADNRVRGCSDIGRFAAYKIVTQNWFEYIIVGVILCNIVTLSLWQPTKDANKGRNQVLTLIEQIFLVVYVLEMILLIVSDGLRKPNNITRPAYLMKRENLLDLTIVVVGTIEFALWINGGKDAEDGGSSFGLAALRALRVLRVLKFVKALPKLRHIVGVLHTALPNLLTVLAIGLVRSFCVVQTITFSLGHPTAAFSL